MAGRGIRAERQAKRLRSVTLDVDSAPIKVHGHQPQTEWKGHYNARNYHPLITSIAGTGDMLDARLRAGNAGTAEGALDVILDVKEREGDLLLDRFFLVTSLDWTRKTRREVLAHYRERGKAEGHMGELKDVLAPAFAIVARTMYRWLMYGWLVHGKGSVTLRHSVGCGHVYGV